MTPRLPFLASSLLALTTACADDVVVTPDRFDPRAPLPATAESPERPDAIEPPVCIASAPGIARFGTTAQDAFRDVAITPAGTIVVAGYDRGLDAFGTVVGSRGVVFEYGDELTAGASLGVLDTTGTDLFEGLAIAPDTGTVWLVGRTNGELAGTDARGGFDAVVGDLSATAGFRPLARGFDDAAELPQQIAVARGGLLAIAGGARRSNGDGTAQNNPFVAAFTAGDASATPQWLVTQRRAERERYAAVDAATHVVVVGGGIIDGDAQGMFVATFDRDAGARWRRQLSSLGGDEVVAVKRLPDGDVIWAGTTRSRLGDAQLGGSDVAIGRLDGHTGATEWTAQLGAAGDDFVADLAVDRDGHIHVVGGAWSATDVDAFLMVLDAGGGVVLDERWGSTGHDVPTSVAVDDCGAVVIAGHTTGDLAGPPAGGRDAFLLVTRAAP